MQAIANWYLNWLYDRCWTVEDTLYAYNMGIGRWRKWDREGRDYDKLPKETQEFLRKYKELTNDRT